MRQKQISRKIFFHFVLIHLGLSLVHLLSYQVSHPLFKYLKTTPFAMQISILLILDLFSYFVLGWIYAYFFQDNKRLNLLLERLLIYFGLGFLGIYALIYYLSLALYNPNIMLAYVLLNPWYGTYFIKMNEVDLYSLWWMLSALTPALGLYFGIRLELWMERDK